ncbi:MAG: recombinase family protein [Lachnospiraceae bacterium]
MIEIIDIAKEKHLKLILDTFEGLYRDILDPMVEGMVKLMGVFAELERNMISERVTSGMRNAAAKGKSSDVPTRPLPISPSVS